MAPVLFTAIDAAARYLTNAIGGRTSATLPQAYLDHGAQAIKHAAANSELTFRARPSWSSRRWAA